MFQNLVASNDPLAQELMIDFQKIMKIPSYVKGDKLHVEGKVCNHLYLIATGVARTFYFKDGKDITAHFATEESTITAIDSFIQRKPSRYNIEILEDTDVFSISHQGLHQLLEEKPNYEKYIRLFLEVIYVDLAERIEDLLFHSAKERYDKLISKSPEILQRVNLGHIASFIGITQETLSRIRAKS